MIFRWTSTWSTTIFRGLRRLRNVTEISEPRKVPVHRNGQEVRDTKYKRRGENNRGKDRFLRWKTVYGPRTHPTDRYVRKDRGGSWGKSR